MKKPLQSLDFYLILFSVIIFVDNVKKMSLYINICTELYKQLLMRIESLVMLFHIVFYLFTVSFFVWLSSIGRGCAGRFSIFFDFLNYFLQEKIGFSTRAASKAAARQVRTSWEVILELTSLMSFIFKNLYMIHRGFSKLSLFLIHFILSVISIYKFLLVFIKSHCFIPVLLGDVRMRHTSRWRW